MEVRTTFTPHQDIGFEKPVLSAEFLNRLGPSVYAGLSMAKAQRETLMQTLAYWNDMNEMNVAERDGPWPNASNLCVPIVAMMKEAVQSKLASAAFVPRLYVVSPLTPEAAPFSQETENYYNGKWHQDKEIRQHLDCLDLSLRDGVAWMEVLWEKRTKTRNVVELVPTGEVDEKTGREKKKKTYRKLEVVEKNGTRLEAVALEDLIFVPAFARSAQEAGTVWRRCEFTEQQLRNMCVPDEYGERTLIPEQVDKIIATHSPGQQDIASREDSTATYETAGTIDVGDSGTTDVQDDSGKSLRSKGTFELWRGHTNEYDLDEDGVFEENVIWFHEPSQIVAGYGPFEYFHGKRPFAKLATMPRPNRSQGYSVPERERAFQEEANARHNQRGDAMDIKICPPFYHTAGAKVITKDRKFGPGVEWEVTSKTDVGIIDMGTIDMSSYQEESMLFSFAARMVGLDSPSLPLMGTQRMGDKQKQAFQTGTNVRLDLMAMELRLFCQEVLEMKHELTLQYGSDEMENELGGQGLEFLDQVPGRQVYKKMRVPFEALAQDHRLGVAGTEGALDKENRHSDIMVLYSLLLQNPLVQADMKRVHEATSMVLDSYNIPSYERLIGTPEDAENQQKAQQQAAEKQHQEELALQLAAHSKTNLPATSANGQAPTAMPIAAQ